MSNLDDMTRGRAGPDAFLMGVSKAASTWIYRCLGEHPRVFVPRSDSLRFFDLHYDQGIEAYERHFDAAAPGQIRVDPSPTYLRSPVAAERIARHYPDARFVVSLRNPIDRAFSQYWHEKKQGRLDYGFDDAIEHLLLFPWLVEHGFYATHLEALWRHFPREQVMVVLYDDLVAEPRRFLDGVLAALGLPPGFEPSMLGRRVNEAGAVQTSTLRAMKSLRKKPWMAPLRRAVKRVLGPRSVYRELATRVSHRDEYETGMSPAARQRLMSIYRDEILRLQGMIGRDLSGWLAEDEAEPAVAYMNGATTPIGTR